MKHLEQLILGSCYGENNVKRVSFLESTDFTLKLHSKLFQAIQETGCTIEAVRKNKHLKDVMVGYSTLLGTYKPEGLALRLLEHRFKALLTSLLYNLSSDTKNSLEVSILNEAIILIPDSDVFDLSDCLIEYVGHHASDYTKNRITAFLKYRNERIATVKKVTNELS